MKLVVPCTLTELATVEALKIIAGRGPLNRSLGASMAGEPVIALKYIDRLHTRKRYQDYFGCVRLSNIDSVPGILNGRPLDGEGIFWIPNPQTAFKRRDRKEYYFEDEKHLRFVGCLTVDLDCHKVPEYSGISFCVLWSLIQETLQGSCTTQPNICVFSGRGLYLMWLLEVEAKTRLIIHLYRQIHEKLGESLADFGADNCASPTHYFRFPNSLHEKSKARVRYYLHDVEPYSIFALAECLGIPNAKAGVCG